MSYGTSFSHPEQFPYLKDAVCASTMNLSNAAKGLGLFLHFKLGFEFEMSEDILLQALSNHNEVSELVRVLADQWKILPVTEKSKMAAVRNERNGTNTFEFLLRYCEFPEKMLTENVLQATIEGRNIEFVEYFKQKRSDFEVKEEFLKAVINRYSINNAILRVLLSQEARCAISKSLLEAAARTGNQSTLEVLLEQRAGSDMDAYTVNLAKVKLLDPEIDDQTTFEEVLSAA